MAGVFMSWLHFVLVVSIVSVLTLEMAFCRECITGMTAETVRRLARLDALYGLCALGLIAAGILRAVHYEKGWEFYQASMWFWLKMAAFGVIGVLSIVPTLYFRRWRKLVATDGSLASVEADVAKVRRFVHWQLGLLPLVILGAAMMARGY